MHLKKSGGFTLIELLVVISIIGLLSSIVVPAVQKPRTSAQNQSKNSLVRAYHLALESYHSEYGRYPDPVTDNTACLGDYPSDTCWGSITENPNLNTALNPLVPGLPADDTPVFLKDVNGNNITDYTGIVYVCLDPMPADDRCQRYSIQWMLNGEGQQCPGYLGLPFKSQGGITLCEITPE